MDKREMPTFFAHLLKLSVAFRVEMKEELAEIYFEDLADLPLSQVIEAITWARKNLQRFATIADLRIQVEGSDEDHANKAWDALMHLLHAGPHNRVTLSDPIMALTILRTWRTWPETCSFFQRPVDEFARTATKRAFKIAYTENYKNRERIRRETTSPAEMHTTRHPNHDIASYEQLDYLVDTEYNVIITNRCTILPAPDQGRGPIPDDMKERFASLLDRIGNNHDDKYNSLRSPDPRHRAGVPFHRDRHLDNLLSDIRNYDQSSDVQDDSTKGNQADRNHVPAANREPRQQ